MAAWLYDGRSAARRSVDLEAESTALRLRLADSGETFEAEWQKLLHVESRADAEVYGHEGFAGWRLTIARPLPPELAPHLPRARVYGRWIDRVGLWPAVAALLLVSTGVVTIGYFAPAWLAPLVPRSWERSFGDALVGDFGNKFCAQEDGRRALDRLAAKLSPASVGELRVRVVDVPIVNAAALPGGTIVIFRQLLTEARGSDEVAGVLAHEIAHVDKRHVTQMMIREFGLSMILTTLGGNTAGSIDTLLSARYSRGSETQADDEAIAALRRANISPRPTAEFFARLSALERRYGRLADTLVYVSTHPLSEGRGKKFEEAADPGKAYTPALTPEEWKALSSICGSGKSKAGEG